MGRALQTNEVDRFIKPVTGKPCNHKRYLSLIKAYARPHEQLNYHKDKLKTLDLHLFSAETTCRSRSKCKSRSRPRSVYFHFIVETEVGKYKKKIPPGLSSKYNI